MRTFLSLLYRLLWPQRRPGDTRTLRVPLHMRGGFITPVERN